jgi:hypothetical protein
MRVGRLRCDSPHMSDCDSRIWAEPVSRVDLDGEVKAAYLKAADRLKSDYESQRTRSALKRQ